MLRDNQEHITIKVNYRNDQCDQNLNTAEYIRDNDRNRKRNKEHDGTTDTIQVNDKIANTAFTTQHKSVMEKPIATNKTTQVNGSLPSPIYSEFFV